jgi:glycolate oxidase
VSKALKLCYENDVPVYVRGGTSLTGSSVLEGGIVMSMLRFDKILEVNIKDRYVIAEARVRVGELNSYLEKYGYMYPPDPASDIAATIG